MRRKSSACRLAATLICAAAMPAFAQAPDRGQALYELNCLTCHYERIHKRDPSRSTVRNLTQLRVEVAERAALTRQRLSVADLDEIAEYLNRTHYRFTK